MLVSLVYVIYSSSNYIEAQTKSSLLDSATNQTDPIKQKRLSENLAQKFNNANGLYENISIIYNRTVLSDYWWQITTDYTWCDSTLRRKLYMGQPLISPVSGKPVIVASSVIWNDIQEIWWSFCIIFWLDTINFIVIKDYKAMINTRIQYYNDAQFIENLVNEFNFKAYQPNNSICNLVQAIIEVSSASWTSMIAEKSSVILERANDIVKVSNDAEDSAEILNDIVSQFKI